MTGAVRRLQGRLKQQPPRPWDAEFDHGRQPVPPGLTAAAPDFVGIGAQKAGTSWWFDLVVAHPAVYHHAAYDKERHFLAKRGAAGDLAVGELAEDYASWFPRPAGMVSGEWTPAYLYYYWVADLLAAVAPDARILVLLRDPVERYLSALAHGAGGKSASQRQQAFERGFYAAQLEPWEQRVDASQLLVLQYERCCLEPAAELARTYRFLGLDDAVVPAAVGAGHVPRSKPPLSPDRLALLQDRYAPDVRALAARYPDIDLSLWPSFAALA